MTLQRLNPQQFEQFSKLIYEKSGICIGQQKVLLLSNRIRRRLKAAGFDDFDRYFRHLKSRAGGEELREFLDEVTTNETFFFRTGKHFDWLKNDWLAAMIAEHRAGRRPASLRIWSAGCATGAEPYTIAICLAENMYRLRNWSIQILATDISQQSLQAARQGRFAPRAVEGVTDRQRQRYFQSLNNGELWQVRPEIQQLVEFRMHNLMQPLQEAPFDCIFIRNVLIYFDRVSKQKVIDNLLRVLHVGGHLAVGPSEGIYDMLDGLQKISPLLYHKAAAQPPRGKVGGSKQRP